MVAGVLKASAPRADSLAMRLPPHRMPRLRNVRLSVKLGLSFGAILALTVAIIAVDVHNVKGLESAHNRVTKGVVPRVIAAQRAEAAFADLHFAQTSMVLTGGKTRADEMDDLAVANQAVAALRKTDRDAGSAKRVAVVTDAIKTWNVLDAKLYAAVKRGDTGYAEQTVAGYAGRRGRQRDHRHRALHHPGQPRPRAGRCALRHAGEHDQALEHRHRRAGPAGRAGPRRRARTPPRPPAARRARRPPRRSPRATSTTCSP